MIDLDYLRQHPNVAERKFRERGLKPNLKRLLKLDRDHRQILQEVEALRAERNQKSKTATADASIRIVLRELKSRLTAKESELNKLEGSLRSALAQLPNLQADDVPIGPDETANRTVREVGERPDFSFTPRDYFDLARNLDLIDTEKSADVAGSRFAYLKNSLVLIEFALIQHAFNKLTAQGFIPVIPPMMIRPDVFQGMGRLAGDQKEERYHVAKDDLYLIGSAEHTLGPLHLNETLAEAALPKRYVGFSSCFRREAGSYGKDTKGILRVHQFDKVEMFVFATPDHAETEHQRLLALQEQLVQDLKLPYRVVEMCTGDIGWTDYRQFDIQTWFPAQRTYRETHSCSNTSDFQARGINARYRSKQGVGYMHLLNATAYAMSRTMAAIIENYQQADGSVAIPQVLRPYLNGQQVITKPR
ncbi:MAG: serine--tRNA ligase [Candidatus Kerfeldbacteria bacterium]|nr:serine--tRNA ligase [Candidatus Kerfeldbacteria bacterium]